MSRASSRRVLVPDTSDRRGRTIQIWVTETALSSALNTSYFAEQVALFSIVMGIALLLAGVGFGVVTLRVLRREPSDDRARAPKAAKPLATT